MDCSTPGFPVLQHLPELAQTHVHRVGDALQPSCSLSSPSLLPSIFSSIREFSNESALHIRWPKYWSFSFSITPSNKYTGLISFWLVGSPFCPRDSKESSLTPQFKSINSSGFNLLYGPTLTSIHDYCKTIALTIRTFVGKVMSLLFNMLSKLVIPFLPRSKHLLISWLQSSSGMVLEPKKIKSLTFPLFPHLFAMKWWDNMSWSSFFEG